MTNKIDEELEAMVDKSDLEAVVTTLAQICAEKAEHLRANWQDEKAAKAWERDAARLIGCAAKLEN